MTEEDDFCPSSAVSFMNFGDDDDKLSHINANDNDDNNNTSITKTGKQDNGGIKDRNGITNEFINRASPNDDDHDENDDSKDAYTEQLNELFRCLFDKCAKQDQQQQQLVGEDDEDSNNNSACFSLHRYAQCVDLIECLSRDIALSQEALDALKELFHEHSSEYLHEEISFDAFSRIGLKWVAKLNLHQHADLIITAGLSSESSSSSSSSSNKSEEVDETLASAAAVAAAVDHQTHISHNRRSSKKKQQLKHAAANKLMDASDDFSFSSSQSLSSSSSSSQLPIGGPHQHHHTHHTLFSSKSTSSIQSVDYEISSSTGAATTINSSQQQPLLEELKQANAQLRQYIGDLKMQLAQCEETNLQLASELDESTRRSETERARAEKEWHTRLKALTDENDQLRRVSETLRLRVSDLGAECAFLTTNLKDALGRIETYEVQSGRDAVELKRLAHDFTLEKTRSNDFEKLNSTLEQQLNEVLKTLKDQNEMIESLSDNLKEFKLENENLKENLNKLDICEKQQSLNETKLLNGSISSDDDEDLRKVGCGGGSDDDKRKNEKNFFMEKFEHDQNSSQISKHLIDENQSETSVNSEFNQKECKLRHDNKLHALTNDEKINEASRSVDDANATNHDDGVRFALGEIEIVRLPDNNNHRRGEETSEKATAHLEVANSECIETSAKMMIGSVRTTRKPTTANNSGETTRVVKSRFLPTDQTQTQTQTQTQSTTKVQTTNTIKKADAVVVKSSQKSDIGNKMSEQHQQEECNVVNITTNRSCSALSTSHGSNYVMITKVTSPENVKTILKRNSFKNVQHQINIQTTKTKADIEEAQQQPMSPPSILIQASTQSQSQPPLKPYSYRLRKMQSLSSLVTESNEYTQVSIKRPPKPLMKDMETQTSMDIVDSIDVMSTSSSSYSSGSYHQANWSGKHAQQNTDSKLLLNRGDSGIDSDQGGSGPKQQQLCTVDEKVALTPTNKRPEDMIALLASAAAATTTRENSRSTTTTTNHSMSLDDADCCLNFDDCCFVVDPTTATTTAARQTSAGAHAGAKSAPDTFSLPSFVDGCASNKREIFKNSYNKHHTIAVLVERPKQINLGRRLDNLGKDESSMSSKQSSQESNDNNGDNEKFYEKHLDKMRAFKPIIEFTSMSKLATSLKSDSSEKQERLKSATSLSIDDYLDTNVALRSLSLVRPLLQQQIHQQSSVQSEGTATASVALGNKLTDNLNRRRRGITIASSSSIMSRTKSMMMSTTSMSGERGATGDGSSSTTATSSISFDDATTTSTSSSSSSSSGNCDDVMTSSSLSSSSSSGIVGPNEHRLKLLESNFNQISIAHHTDESLVETCMDKYMEKFFKTDSYLNYLFDEIGEFLNKLVNCLNELNRAKADNEETNSSKATETEAETAAKAYSETFGNEAELMSMQPQLESIYALTKSNRRFLQDNLTNLNKTIALVRKSMIELVIDSTLIGGLKQESHLSELVKISISYVKALKKSYREKTSSFSSMTTTTATTTAATNGLTTTIHNNNNNKMKHLTNNQTTTKPVLKRSMTISPMSGGHNQPPQMPPPPPSSTRFGRRLNSLQYNIAAAMAASEGSVLEDEADETTSIQSTRSRSNTIQTCEHLSDELVSHLLSIAAKSTTTQEDMKKQQQQQDESSLQSPFLAVPMSKYEPDADEVRIEEEEPHRSRQAAFDVEDEETVAAAVEKEENEYTGIQCPPRLLTTDFCILTREQRQKCIEQTRAYARELDAACKRLYAFVRADSFKFLRLALSFVIFFFSLVFFLLTFVQDEDFYESFFKVIKDCVVVTNPTNNLRAT